MSVRIRRLSIRLSRHHITVGWIGWGCVYARDTRPYPLYFGERNGLRPLKQIGHYVVAANSWRRAESVTGEATDAI